MGSFLQHYGAPIGTGLGMGAGTLIAPGAGTVLGGQIGGMAGGASSQLATGPKTQNVANQPNGSATDAAHAAKVQALMSLLQQSAAQNAPPQPQQGAPDIASLIAQLQQGVQARASGGAPGGALG